MRGFTLCVCVCVCVYIYIYIYDDDNVDDSLMVNSMAVADSVIGQTCRS